MPIREMPPSRLAYISCARGYAILLVIAAHATLLYPHLPIPFARVVRMGIFGVQLFFLASVVTLLMSWRAEKLRNAKVDLLAFAVRRVARIAPAYLLGGLAYFVIRPPAVFSWEYLAENILFINAWNIDATVGPSAWMMVPGGWSISVEASLYVVFPLYAFYAKNLSRALIVLLASILVAMAVNQLADRYLMQHHPAEDVVGFLFFWPPNQAPVFALGGVTYFLLGRTIPIRGSRYWSGYMPIASAACLGAIAFAPLPPYLASARAISVTLASALVMVPGLLALATGGPAVNRVVARVGDISFSAYILHFAVLDVAKHCPSPILAQTGGLTAVVGYAGTTFVVATTTIALATICYRFVERPGIAAGQHLSRAIRSMPRGQVC